MNNKKRNEKGFTMVELIIVVAIMAIIGAMLVPTFGKMATKARLTTDLSTVKTLQRVCDSYKAEKGKYPTGDVTAAIADFATAGLIDSGTASTTQTDGASFTYDATKGKFQLDATSATDPDVADILKDLKGQGSNDTFLK